MLGTGDERAGGMPGLLPSAWADRVRRLAAAAATMVEERAAAPVFANGAPSPFQVAFGGDRLIPFIDDWSLLAGPPRSRIDRLWRRPALAHALRRLPLVLASSETAAAFLRSLASPATDVAVCRPQIADVYAAIPFLERAASTRHVAPRGRIDVALFTSAGDDEGLRRAADAVAHLRKGHGHEACLHVIGRQVGIEVADEILTRPGVFFHGFIPADRVREILMSAHVLLSAADGFRLADVPLEAAYAGLPAVMPDRPLFREAFVGTAAYVETASATALAARIAAVVTTPEIFRVAAAAAPANLARWNDLARSDREAVQDSLARAGLATVALDRAIPFLPSRFRP
ncbi:glycosyltransferase [Chthonobacter albigriseus]|uniref:glycosyltransferase n=1 Tax=Chthonobacter albigriseus TaxID=1683161 RepID=UPI0015EFA8FE|nr:glycosyltransferase [Chthonobacter albigriseus]